MPVIIVRQNKMWVSLQKTVSVNSLMSAPCAIMRYYYCLAYTSIIMMRLPAVIHKMHNALDGLDSILKA